MCSAPAMNRAQMRRVTPRMNVVIFRGNSTSFLGADEPSVHHAALEPGAAGLHPADRLGERILSQRNAEIRNNLCRRTEVLEQPRHTRTEHVTRAGPRRGLVSGKPEEVIALVMREVQRQRDRLDRLLGRTGAAARRRRRSGSPTSSGWSAWR